MLRYCLLFLSLAVTSGYAQQSIVSGKVTDTNGHPIPFASVYVQNFSINTITNEKGQYFLRLNPGHFKLTFRHVGYQLKEIAIELTDFKFLDVKLEAEVFHLSRVDMDYNQDLADDIARKVIARRRNHLKESSFFSCDVYIKSVQKLLKTPKRFLGEDVSESLHLVDSKGQRILYQSEAHSKLYLKGDKRKEVMQASKNVGENPGFNFYRALDLKTNLYGNLLQWPALSSHNFVSPVADNAFSYYHYDYYGASEVGGKTIFKIKVSPRRKYDPAFNGFIYVLKDDWRLYSVELYINNDNHIDFVDSLRITQQFVLLNKNVWQPSNIIFQFYGRVLGFEFAGHVIGAYSNYQLNPPLKNRFFNNNEVLKVNEGIKKDRSYWIKNRPIPLTIEEELIYQKKDSLELMKNSKPFLDSLQHEENKFRPLRFLITGYRLRNLSKNSFWHFRSVANAVFYNTVEGWGVNLRARYHKQLGSKRYIEFEPNVRYGFSSKIWNLNAEVTYQYDTLNHASVTFKGGSDFLDLNSRGTINLFQNTLSTLFRGRNYLKLYHSHFVSIRTQREVIDGFQLTAGAEIARRLPVMNTSYKPIFDNARRTLTSNNPLLPATEINLFPINNAFTMEAKASYTPAHKYTTTPEGKIYEPARFPTIQVNYRKGIKGWMNSVVDYDFMAVDVYQDKIKAGIAGYGSFYFSAGKFLNTNSLYFPDLQHFTGNQTPLYNPLFPNFHFLDYYAFSTNDKYLEGHFEHNFSGLFISKLPLVRELKLEEIIGGAFLAQPLRNYKEIYIGFQRLILRVDYGISWSTGKPLHHAFRIFYGL